MNTERFKEVKAEILQANRAFLPTADIKYIGWLTRRPPLSIVIKFTRAEDANKIIDEGLLYRNLMQGSKDMWLLRAVTQLLGVPIQDRPGYHQEGRAGLAPREDEDRREGGNTYNVYKSKDTVMATLLRDPRVAEYDMLVIQEPWRNPFILTTHHPAKEIFHLCYPTVDDGEGPAWLCFFINKRLDHSAWQFKQHTRDLCTLKISTNGPGASDDELIIHNVYNAPQNTMGRNSILPLLKIQLEEYAPKEQIALGDFNLHH
ncbi:uncharacterized protein PV09_09717 [Verruconis gallopava]|uniref:Endonuclease/exonuclease/phosphatase domain-containing protein n=1 Tax=Verruconis gallopava TaxID=253628 RepID=A0A0D1ZVI3_9PEZI|nr:uncharacterized protein PV09_09717 [Verruconis gallopava]KIV98472.1 hypothetical protein PV09_09717 [Verruconis gallopava]